MYLKFYHLKNEPFHITPDPEFLFLSPSHKEVLSSIIYGIEMREGFVSIIGKDGTGKTTIIRSYLERFAQERIKPIYLFNVNISFTELLKSIFREFGVVQKNKDVNSLIRQLHEILIEEYRQNHIIVLIIDDAQNMPVEMLEKLLMLSNLEIKKEKLLQIVLVGQPELEKKLNCSELRQLKQRFTIQASLYPLSRKESQDYIHHRLSLVTLDSEPVFTPRAMKRIVKHAKGIPRVLHILCDNSLIAGFGYQSKSVTLKIVKEVIDDYEGKRKLRYLLWRFAPVAGLILFAGIVLTGTYPDSFFSKMKDLKSMQNTLFNSVKTIIQGAIQPHPSGNVSMENKLVVVKPIKPIGSVRTEEETAFRPKTVSKPLAGGLSIAASAVCKAVNNRLPLGEQYVFSIRETRKPVIWMDARSEKPPRMIKHIYFCNGQKYCEVPLLIKYPRMRTWSHITLDTPAHIGTWRVDIATEDGEILEQLAFRVIP